MHSCILASSGFTPIGLVDQSRRQVIIYKTDPDDFNRASLRCANIAAMDADVNCYLLTISQTHDAAETDVARRSAKIENRDDPEIVSFNVIQVVRDECNVLHVIFHTQVIKTLR